MENGLINSQISHRHSLHFCYIDSDKVGAVHRVATKLTSQSSFAFFYGIVFSLYSFRAYFLHGLFPGDNFDARATTTSFEHWWYFYQGKESFRNLLFFAPEINILGGSESFFIQGLPYSFFRFIGIDQTYSWFLANFIILALGAMGLLKLLNLILQDRVLVASAALLILFSYQLNIQLSHPQTFCFLLSSWWFYYLIRMLVLSPSRYSLTCFFVWTAILPLASLYTVLGTFIISITCVIFTLLSDRKVFFNYFLILKKNIRTAIIESLPARLAGLLPIFSFIVFVQIYWKHFLNNQFGSFAEVSFYLPRLFDLLNASIGAGGYSAKFYSWGNLGISGSYERAMGFPLLFFVLIFFVFATFVVQSIKLPVMTRVLILCGIFLTFLPIADERGQSFWYLLWVLPGGESIRSPARFWIFAQIIWVIATMLIVRQSLPKHKGNRYSIYSLLIVLSLLVSVDQYRPSLANWNGELLTSFGRSAELALSKQNCSLFYLGSNRQLTFNDNLDRQIDGMVIAYKLGVPTVNGYSSNFPPGWPQLGAWGLAPLKNITDWIELKSEDQGKILCYYSETGLSRIDYSN